MIVHYTINHIKKAKNAWAISRPQQKGKIMEKKIYRPLQKMLKTKAR